MRDARVVVREEEIVCRDVTDDMSTSAAHDMTSHDMTSHDMTSSHDTFKLIIHLHITPGADMSRTWISLVSSNYTASHVHIDVMLYGYDGKLPVWQHGNITSHAHGTHLDMHIHAQQHVYHMMLSDTCVLSKQWYVWTHAAIQAYFMDEVSMCDACMFVCV